jgi:tyrosyl-tRNA synthetase
MDRFNLIKRHTQEILTEDELRKLLKEKKKPSAYIGYAPTGRLHAGHIIPLMKIGDFLKAGFNFKFLIADLHAYLDDQKTPWHLLDARAECYKETVKGVFSALGIDTKDLEFVKGSDFQLKADYMLDVLKMVGDVTLSRSRRAASEVVRFKKEPKLGGFIYPLMQIEDIVALDVDVAFGGQDQRHIYSLGREILPKLGYKKPICVFTPLLPGLTGEKMSASVEGSKIDLLDDVKIVEKKVNKSYCELGKVEGNGLLVFLEYVVFPLRGKVVIKREEKFGGNSEYKIYDKLEKDYKSEKIHPADLKKAVSLELNKLLEPVRKRFEKKKDLLEKAYPNEKSG